MSPSDPSSNARRILLGVGQRLLQSKTVREAVKNEVLRSVTKQRAGKAAEPRTDLGQQMAEVWQHPAVQQAVRGGVKTVSEQTRQWREKLGERAAEREKRELTRKSAKSPAEVARLAELRAQREREQRRKELRAELLTRAQNPTQRELLTLLFGRTPWLGGEGEALRYTQLLDALAPNGSLEREMSAHRALWTLAEARVLAVSPHGEITLLLPEGVQDQD